MAVGEARGLDMVKKRSKIYIETHGTIKNNTLKSEKKKRNPNFVLSFPSSTRLLEVLPKRCRGLAARSFAGAEEKHRESCMQEERHNAQRKVGTMILCLVQVCFMTKTNRVLLDICVHSFSSFDTRS